MLKSKFAAVAEAKQVSKSLVIKSNKQRKELEEQLALNKHKKNTGGIRDARQRRRISIDRSKRAEKYPLASKLHVADFKLRKLSGCKVTKLWIRKKMKSKIEMCYGKEVADKFNRSSNWYQRF